MTTPVTGHDWNMTLVGLYVLTLTLWLSPVAIQADAIRLKRRVMVTHTEVRLSDVARLQGEHAEKLADLTLLMVPPESKSAVIGIDTVRKALTSREVNWAFITLGGFETCEVILGDETLQSPANPQPHQSASTTLIRAVTSAKVATNAHANANSVQPVSVAAAVTTLRDQAVQAIVEFAGVPLSQLRMVFEQRDHDKLDIQAEPGRFEVIPLSRSPLGRVMLGIREYDGNRLVDRKNIAVEVTRQAEVLVAARPIARGTKLGPDDLEAREVVLADSAVQTITKKSEALGRVAQRSFRVGEPIDHAQLTQPLMVKRNDIIDVRAMIGGILVSTKARAREDGVLGQAITVKNLRSREQFMAVVTGPRQVEVAVNGSRPAETHADAP